MSESGLRDIWEAMAELERMVEATPGIADADLAEGRRFIAGLYQWGIDRVFMGSDVERPRFIRFTDAFSQWGLANPDNVYLVAEISPGESYVIRGNRGTCATFVVEVRTGIGRREDDVHSKTLAFMEAVNIVFGPDGQFELQLGDAPRLQNHLPLPPDATTILVRATLSDWLTETMPLLSIDRRGFSAPPVKRPSSGQTALQFKRAASLILALGKFNDKTAANWRSRVPVNAFPPPASDSVTLAPFPGQQSSVGQFALPDTNHALVVTLDPVECSYLGFSIGNLYWYTNLDFGNRQTSLNTMQARRSSDGKYRYVIGGFDPGVPNWIDTGGRLSGFMFFRCQGLRSTSIGQPQATLVPMNDLARALPADEPRISPEERLESLKQRRLAVDRRYAY